MTPRNFEARLFGDEHQADFLAEWAGGISVEPVEASYDQVIARNRRDGQWVTVLGQLIREGPR